MSTQLQIDGVTFLPIKEAAKVVSYSRDYVAKLAREEKIVASQIGRQWYVDLLSLKSFAEAAALEQEVRKQKLSAERKREQSIKSEVRAIGAEVQARARRGRIQARVFSVAVLLLGLVTGFGVYSLEGMLAAADHDVNVARLGAVAPRAVAVEEVVLPEVTPMPTALYTTVLEQPVFVPEPSMETVPLTNAPEGIVLLSREGAVRDAAAVARLFSDEVSVRFDESQSLGVVTYLNSDGVETEYQFVSVPAPMASSFEE